MRLTRLVVLSLAMHAGMAAPVPAQTYEVQSNSSLRTVPDSWLRSGAPIRVHRVGGSTLTGTFEDRQGDVLRLRTSGSNGGIRSEAVPLHDVAGLDLGREQTTRTWSGFRVGLLAGVAAGAALGAASSERGDKAAGAILVGILLAPVGSLIGSLIGASDHHTEWVSARIPGRDALGKTNAPSPIVGDATSASGCVR